jgi:hypothetical protein
MPKKFPTPPDATDDPSDDAPVTLNIHPTSFSFSMPLADLLFGGADLATIAEHLRTVRDESKANDLAAWLVMCRDALPVLRRADQDGIGVTLKYHEHQQYMSLRPLGGDPAANAERKRIDELNARQVHAECALLGIRQFAPALLDDPRSQQVGDVADSAAITELRMSVTTYFVEKKLEVSPAYDGWPHCAHRDDSRTAGTVRLVAVAPPGVRR